MKIETFFEKFDQFADVPDVVEKMRELVLQLAVQGKLVPQDPSNEPAEEEIRRIPPQPRPARFDKRSTANVQGIAALSVGKTERDIPTGWSCVPLIQIARLESGHTPSRSRPDWWGGDVSWVGVVDARLHNGKTIFETLQHTNKEGLANSAARLLPAGTVCVSRTASVGYVTILGKPMATSQDFVNWVPSRAVMSDWLRLVFTSEKDAFNRFSKGAVHQTIYYPEWLSMHVLLPPLAEQRRIVAKVDELMALCDRLEAQQKERETRHAALARTSLARFADAPTPANLLFLFHPSYAISPADLRKSILTLAVQGKLVPQDPNDEPAEELIASIATIRRAKKAKEYEPVPADEMPYEVPFSWAWIRLGNISINSDSGWSPQCLPEARSGTDWGVLKVSAVSWGVFKPEENKALPPGMTSRPDCQVKAGDFLLSRANTQELVARSVVIHQTPPGLMMSDKIVRFTFPDEIERAFINLANTSEPSRDYYARNASGTSSSMKNIGRETMCNLPIALPPFAEQRRIVAKVEQLMTLVDKLETQLAASRATAASLLSALVAELTGTARDGKVAVPSASGTARRGRPKESQLQTTQTTP